MLKKNTIGFGILVGCFAPIFGVLIFYFLKFYPTFSFKEYLEFFKQYPQFITAIASLSLFVNVAFLTFYFNKRKDKTAIGIFSITLLYGLIALIIKLLL